VELLIPVALTIFVWWFATGAVLYLNGLPACTFRWSNGITGLIGLCGLAALYLTREDTTPLGAYAAFFGALAVWAWNEMSFLLGHITGSSREDCPGGVHGVRRFILATRSIIYHELVILASAAAIALVTWGAANRFGLYTFLVFWVMRLSTKFNIFLGVPNITVQFLPKHLAYLATYFAHRPMNLLFPFSVTASTLAAAWLIHLAIQAPAGGFESVGYAMVATLLVLGVLEHWFLVIPLPFGELWSWGLGSREDRVQPSAHKSEKSQPLALTSAIATPPIGGPIKTSRT
jgi:putative photosynthetic complex assembly protein 2